MLLQARVNLIAASSSCMAGSTAEYSFDVENTSDRTLTLGVEALGETEAWITLVNRAQAELELPARSVQRVAVKIAAPADAQGKRYTFYVRLYDTHQPTIASESDVIAIDVVVAQPTAAPPPPTPAAVAPTTRPNWLPIIIAASVGGVVLIGAIVGLIIWLTGGDGGVPDLVGMPIDEATALLAEAGYEPPSVSEEASAEQDPGLVLRQSPEAGAEEPADRLVTLVVAAAVPEPPPPSPVLVPLRGIVPGGYYPMTCRGGGMLASPQAVGDDVRLDFAAAPGRAADGLTPGQCTWQDRPLGRGEPTTICDAADHAAQYVRLLARTDQYVVVNVFNDRNGCMRVA
jgi:PASTA domain